MKICLLVLLLAVLVSKGFANTDTVCAGTKECPNGECVIENNTTRKCISVSVRIDGEADAAEGNECTYIKNCINQEDCKFVFSGENREKKCASGLFCRARAPTTDCLVPGMCVTKANANSNEARCLRDASADSSRCSIDGDYRCSTTESNEGRVTQTCYSPSTGEVTGRVVIERSEDVAKIDCRERLATCTAINGKEVLSGDRVEDPNNRCSYCLCKDGVINRTECAVKMDCNPTPRNCTYKGESIPSGKVVTSLNGCAQKRCQNGTFVEIGKDNDCNGEDDVDECAGQSDKDIVCVRTTDGVRARVPKCKARSIANSVYSDKDCDERNCTCQGNEICVGNLRPTELCIDTSTDSSGCKVKRCIPKADNFRCSTQDTNRKVCSTSGNSYSSECEAFINKDYELKYLRDCNDTVCMDNNEGRGFCGFDKKTYPTLCDLERRTGSTLRDYSGTCVTSLEEPSSLCEDIPVGCTFTSRASDANCPIPGGQGVLHVDVTEAQEYAFRKSKSDLDINDLCGVVESDWEKLTGYNIKDDKCELTCRAKYDTIAGIVVQAKAEQGTHCTTCGDRMRDFVSKVRQGKSTNTVPGSRNRRQTDESDYSGLFINPSELNNDPNFHNGAYNLIASSLLIIASVILAFMF